VRIGLLTSVPATLDAFFPSWIEQWRAEGHVVSPASGPGPQGGPAGIEGSQVIEGITRNPRPTNGTAHRRLRAWAAQERLDVILTSTATASAIVRTARTGVPVVYFCHGLHWGGDPSWRDAVPRTLERVLVRSTAAAISLNSQDDLWFSARLPAGRPHLRLRSGVGLELTDWPHVTMPARREPLRMVWVAEMSTRKRPLDALAVVEHVAAAGIDVSLTMLGDGPMLAEVRSAAAGNAAVEVLGRADPHPYLAAAHLLLHTGAWEGLPRVGLEAAAVGRTTHGYDVKGVRDTPGAVVAGRAGDTVRLAESIARWWAAGDLEPHVDRSSLDWRDAHAQVTALLGSVSGPV
jgi:glycosyltransferase involved in cell wall biosynthesis